MPALNTPEPLITGIPLEWIPLDLVTPNEPLLDVLNRILIVEYDQQYFNPITGGSMTYGLSVAQEVVCALPGLDGFALVLGGSANALFTVKIGIGATPVLTVELAGRIRLRFPREWLRPVVKQNNAWVDDPARKYVEIDLSAGIKFVNGEIQLANNSFSLQPAMIAETGCVIEGNGVIDVSETQSLPESQAMGLPSSWRGLVLKTLKFYTPTDLNVPIVPTDLTLTNFHIGSGGISGSVSGHWSPTITSSSITGSGAGSLFGFSFGLKEFQVSFLQNTPTGMSITGAVLVPFFNEVFDNVGVGLDLNGNWQVSLPTPAGGVKLRQEGAFELILETIKFKQAGHGALFQLGGSIQPLVAGVKWPSFKVNELTIDTSGNIDLDGGWLNLPDQYSLDFHGFQMEITKLGMGKTTDGGKWIGFSGGIKLVDGLPIGVSVEGLRISWYDSGASPTVSFEGIGVEFAIPGALAFKGSVAYKQVSATEHRFDGAIKLNLIALGLEIDGKLVIGRQNDVNYFAIYLGVELPAGIPLGPTGLGLYGLAGLFAVSMQPNKTAQEKWYDWYKRDQVGVTDLENKWKPQPQSFAFGAGVTLGSVADNGYAFSGRILLALVFPGPVLILEGKANLLKERAKLNGEEPIFRALAVLDANEGTFLFNLDARYKIGSHGELLDLAGGAEGYFGPDTWHLYLGQKEPRDKRIRAKLFSLFDAQNYFMLDPKGVQVGSWVGYGNSWTFGPFKLTLEAWLETNVAISWKPVHFHGDLWAHGKAELSIFGWGFGLAIDGRLAADVFDPFHLLAELQVEINLPWPIPDFEVDLKLEWGPEKAIPALPAPVQDIAAEHLKVSTKWPLPRSTDGNAAPNTIPDIPVVPPDVRPTVTFHHAVADNALFSVNPRGVKRERIGDPNKNEGPLLVSYGLTKVELHEWTGSAWSLAAVSPPPDEDTKRLFGSWAPIVKNHVLDASKQNKLQVWSKNSFDYLRNVSSVTFSDWASGVTDCAPLPAPKTTCWTINATDVPGAITSPWHCPKLPLSITWADPATIGVATYTKATSTNPNGTGITGFIFPHFVEYNSEFRTWVKQHVTLHLASPASRVELTLYTDQPLTVSGMTDNLSVINTVQSGVGLQTVTVLGQGISRVAFFKTVDWHDDDFDEITILTKICVTEAQDPADVWQTTIGTTRIKEATAYWYDEDEVLKPHTTYRLAVTTSVDAQGDGELADYDPPAQLSTDYAFFTTGGPPGTTRFSAPGVDPDATNFKSGLDDLTVYVRQTIPATVPAPGEPPILPRPVYRGYEFGVDFNENYVDLLYRLGQRDLGMYLYDNNNRPVRDAHGNVLSLMNAWGHNEALWLSAIEELWVQAINTGTCTTLDPAMFVRDVTLRPQSPGLTLAPDTNYEVRLIPFLLHDDFNPRNRPVSATGHGARLGQWQIIDDGATNAPSVWQMMLSGPAFLLKQTSNIYAGPSEPSNPVKPGTILFLNQQAGLPAELWPFGWTSYRFSVYLRSEITAGTIGVVFHMQNNQTYYRYSMLGGATPYRRLVRVNNNVHTVLAEDHEAYKPNQDYLISVEVELNGRVQVFQDGRKIFDVVDASPLFTGSVGLYCWQNPRASFKDARVESLIVGVESAPITYKFGFTTSRFRNVFHHIHSYQDETWLSTVTAAQLPDAVLAKGVTLPAALPTTKAEAQVYRQQVSISEDEARAYEQTAAAALGTQGQQVVSALQVTRIERTGAPVGFLIQTPEPLDWLRTTLKLQSIADWTPGTPQMPGEVKLVAVDLASNAAAQRWVELVVRDQTKLYRDATTGQPSLKNYRIEFAQPTGATAPWVWKPYYTIGAEDGVSDGLRYRIYDGAPDPLPAPPPNAVYRFSATPSTLQPWESTWTSVIFRIIAPDGAIVHSRGFARPAPEAVPFKVLRKADGTGIVLIGAVTMKPLYQLHFTYRRSNREVDPGSIILKESGRSDDEVVMIDIPWTTL